MNTLSQVQLQIQTTIGFPANLQRKVVVVGFAVTSPTAEVSTE